MSTKPKKFRMMNRFAMRAVIMNLPRTSALAAGRLSLAKSSPRSVPSKGSGSIERPPIFPPGASG